MTMKLSGSVLVMLVLVMLQHALGAVDATSHQAQRRAVAELLVVSALDAIEADGLDKVLGEINNVNSTQFRTEDVNGYVFVFANNGTNLAHGQRPDDYVGRTTDELIASSIPELVGKLDGDKLNAMFVEKAQAGGGWVNYTWIKPATGLVHEKSSYIKQPSGYDDIYVGSGYDVMTDDVVPAPAPTEE
eukprot:CAMPEP_0206122286 /NCGR_PEP_ID=MMETSP1472-20131121/2028_1 /ASSEMBLY_ACC=CAM_ASM_001108 /TAXON_ID=41880 /ORGANISM="Pycnococcus provasolii, Strain RCC251" /LENGTH=187 /DNA_ID=CAMNT_0053512759 /DNA_START=74 /DNA_END=637 /DNA_ORIENTATION=+